jgi:hypothetical protein
MDQERDDQLSTTESANGSEPSEPLSSWSRPAEQKTAMPVVEEAAGPPAPAPHVGALTDAPPSMPRALGNGRSAGTAVAEPATELTTELEEPAEPGARESSESDRPLPAAPAEGTVELMAVESRKSYRARWGAIQTGFVDDPAEAVREADHLVADVMEHLATTFAEERGRLEERWSQGNEDTEHLRMALRRYREFFGLLLKE